MSHVQVPPVTLEDLQFFQAKHFPHTLNAFPLSSQIPTQFHPHPQTSTAPFPPTSIPNEDEEETDNLGYYPDGVKRTLTDEQIRIFRHSEIHALLRERQLAREEEEFQARFGENNEEGEDEAADVPLELNAGEQAKLDTKAKASSSGTGTRRPVDRATSSEPFAKRRSKTKLNTGNEVHLDYNENEERASHQNTRPQTASQFAGRRIISYDD
ncbi:hypothetical protein BDV06DRAFT_220891 [Aspergillus oleicola]